jgi:hypothetical protein
MPLDVHEKIISEIQNEPVNISRKFLNGYVKKIFKFNMDMVWYYQVVGRIEEPQPTFSARTILSNYEIEKIKKIYIVKDGNDFYYNVIAEYQSKIREIAKKNENVFYYQNEMH